MTKFSANLGFLWSDLSLLDAIHAAKDAGFDAVECHWPYDTPASQAKAALAETGLQMLGLNTRRGDVAAGENGLSAVEGRTNDALAAIDEAIEYADIIGAGAVHVMSGNASGADAHETFVSALGHACTSAATRGITILIEPLNKFDAPNYFLKTTAQAELVLQQVGASNLKLMFDCYHVGRTEGDVSARLRELLGIVGHVQFASVPDRGTPDHGDVNYREMFTLIESLGWNKPLGAEYKPVGPTDKTLEWMAAYR